MVVPNLIDQRMAMSNQFDGMTEESFTYEGFESTRDSLISTIHEKLTLDDKNFLLHFVNSIPDWSIYNFESFPAVQWKLQNLQKLKEINITKHTQQYDLLKEVLGSEG